MHPRDVLLRLGGRTLQRHGVLAVAGSRPRHEDLVPSFTRADAASCATFFDRDGLLRVAAAHVPRLDWPTGLVDAGGNPLCGLLLEPQKANPVLHNRDLTNAAWAKTNITPLKDQTGIDGAANSASRITASAGNGTCLQAITLASSARFQTCYVKRLVGSGTIQMTMDNGSTWTPITVTSLWTRVSIPTQTLANPTVGFRIVTSADSIAVDFVQNEAGLYATSPVAVAGSAITRAADKCIVSGIAIPRLVCSLYADVIERTLVTTGTDSRFIGLTGETFTAPYFAIQANQTNGYRAIYDPGTGLVSSGFLSAGAVGDRVRMIARLYSDGSCELERQINAAAPSTSSRSATSSIGSGGWNAQELWLAGGNGTGNGASDARVVVDAMVLRDTPTLAEAEAIA